MASIFLSHSSRDELVAEKLKQQLEQMGSEVYMFEHDPQPGTSVNSKIEKALKSHDILFALLTKQGGESNFVQQEIGYAKGAGKLVVPFVEHGVDHKILALVSDVEYIKFDPNNPDKSISDAQNYVHKHDMKKLATYSAAGLLVILAVVVLLYYASSN